jgi:Carboxypeptidase regulatory-like domain/Viral BACON domain
MLFQKILTRSRAIWVIQLSIMTGCFFDKPADTQNTGIITGNISEFGSGKKLDGVMISTMPQTSSVQTKTNGDYSIFDVKPGNYEISAKKPGYNDGITTVNVEAGKIETANMMLIPISAGLDIHPKILNFDNSSSVLRLTITNSTDTSIIPYVIDKSEDADWLAISKTIGQATGAADVVTVVIDRTTLKPGNHTTTLTFTSKGGGQTIPVVLTFHDPSAPQP